MSARVDRKSIAQASAEAMDRRLGTFADENAASLRVRFDRPSHEPKGLRGYVNELRDAYADECPTRMHRHDVDAGGTPAFTAAFEAWLWGSPFTVDEDSGAYSTPLRACLAGMQRSADERTRKRAAITGRTIIGGVSATEAAITEGVPEWCAEVVAENALRVTWRRLSSSPMPLPKREAVA